MVIKQLKGDVKMGIFKKKKNEVIVNCNDCLCDTCAFQFVESRCNRCKKCQLGKSKEIAERCLDYRKV